MQTVSRLLLSTFVALLTSTACRTADAPGPSVVLDAPAPPAVQDPHVPDIIQSADYACTRNDANPNTDQFLTAAAFRLHLEHGVNPAMPDVGTVKVGAQSAPVTLKTSSNVRQLTYALPLDNPLLPGSTLRLEVSHGGTNSFRQPYVSVEKGASRDLFNCVAEAYAPATIHLTIKDFACKTTGKLLGKAVAFTFAIRGLEHDAFREFYTEDGIWMTFEPESHPLEAIQADEDPKLRIEEGGNFVIEGINDDSDMSFLIRLHGADGFKTGQVIAYKGQAYDEGPIKDQKPVTCMVTDI